MSSKNEIKLQLRFYPEKNVNHRQALDWLKEHKLEGMSYGDLVARAICDLMDRKQSDSADERMRQVVREEIRESLRSVTIAAPAVVASAAVPIVQPPKPAEESLRKAKGFMSGMGFG